MSEAQTWREIMAHPLRDHRIRQVSIERKIWGAQHPLVLRRGCAARRAAVEYALAFLSPLLPSVQRRQDQAGT